MKRLSGWLLKLASVPLNRLITSGYTPGTINGDNDLVNITRLRATIIALMQRNGLVLIPTNTPLTAMGNTVTVDGTTYTLSERQRVLLTGQTTAAQNGFYEWTAAAGGTLTRLWDWRDISASSGVQIAGPNLTDIRARVSNLSNNVLRLIGNDLAVTIDNTSPGTSPALKRDANGNLFIQTDLLPGASGSLSVFDEGNLLGVANSMDFVGSGVRATWNAGLGRAIVQIGAGAADTSLWFGDGSDGDVTISSAVSLTRDMYYNNLTITSTGVLTANAIIHVRGTLTIQAGGRIDRNGVTSTNLTTSVFAPASTGLLYASAGGNGGQGQGASTANNNFRPVAAGANVIGIGGAGGAGAGTPNGAGGVITSTQDFRNPFALVATSPALNNFTGFTGGAGGGGGGCNNTNLASNIIYGGSGGTGAGVLIIRARNITGAGNIEARGGAGSAWGIGGVPSTTTNDNFRAAGGGGGGGGAIIITVSTGATASVNSAAGTGVINGVNLSVEGGQGGLGSSPANGFGPGAAGSVGRILIVNV